MSAQSTGTASVCRVAVFASGRGSNLAALVQYGREHPEWPVQVALVVSDVPSCAALDIARAAAIPCIASNPRDYPDKAAYEAEIVVGLQKHGIQGIALAGYMRIVGPTLLRAYPGRILNLHPSLLPAFPGRHAVRDALAAGAVETGVTVHFVDEGIDTGPVIAQRSVPIAPGVTEAVLFEQIHRVEHALYPVVLGQVAAKWLEEESL